MCASMHAFYVKGLVQSSFEGIFFSSFGKETYASNGLKIYSEVAFFQRSLYSFTNKWHLKQQDQIISPSQLKNIYFLTSVPQHQRQRLGLNARARYLPLLWLVRQSGAVFEHNDAILYLVLHTTGRVTHTPIASCVFAQHEMMQNQLHASTLSGKCGTSYQCHLFGKFQIIRCIYFSYNFGHQKNKNGSLETISTH